MTGTEGTRPLLLVVATGMRTYREYLLRSIGARYRVHLFLSAEPGWEKEHVAGWTVLPSTMDGPAMAVAAARLAEREPVAGVLCWDEARIHAAAFVARAVGARNGDPDVVWGLRDKGRTRAALDAAGVAQPRSVPVKTVEEAVAAARVVGYPAILKPRGLGASLGVVKVADEAQLRAGFAFTLGAEGPEPVVFDTDQPVLVEEFVAGEEISVDSVVRDGEVTPLFVARKVVGYPPYAEEVGHFVDAADPLLSDPALLKALQRTHEALGFTDGVTHSEFMLTGSGPKVIEVNGRLGGDLIPFLGSLATGIDPGLVAAAAATGRPADLTPTRGRVAGIRFFYVAEEDTTLGALGFDHDALPDGIERAVVVAQPGAVVSPPPKGTVWGRIAFAVATGESREQVADRLAAAEAAFEVKPA
ncbi:ATP-grasp domain-containing protein [Saccharothrix algeriensis]|uniref:ATP-grasp domain-containing protein n=1 Tax=Saccharothrix algeriensis TaxID=173560 RepID=A0A8T8HYF8_9PSEU|nr:ATP-grasp domain-containing protein [Saccharothrix algeriensis]MBM7809288.1 biotin carboxylase [Saccharothrix algeriensis]QTR03635.1 ATP-grasp domain-containing protein [Saccharothrix algeriensis]